MTEARLPKRLSQKPEAAVTTGISEQKREYAPIKTPEAAMAVSSRYILLAGEMPP